MLPIPHIDTDKQDLSQTPMDKLDGAPFPPNQGREITAPAQALGARALKNTSMVRAFRGLEEGKEKEREEKDGENKRRKGRGPTGRVESGVQLRSPSGVPVGLFMGCLSPFQSRGKTGGGEIRQRNSPVGSVCLSSPCRLWKNW